MIDVEKYERDGYLVVREAISARECRRLRDVLLEKMHAHQYTITVPRDKVFPEPAKYTLAGNDWAESDLAFIAEHPVILDAVEAVLGECPVLTAYEAYVRPPNDEGSSAHCDYKRWRPVGSSLNWCFAIVALVDFDQDCGPLLVCPGSHKLIARLHHPDDRTVSVTTPDKSKLGPFVDAELNCGDLLLLHGNTWHEAPPNRSNRLRIGMFNKYAGWSAPPAAGFVKWSDAVHQSLSERGRKLLVVHGDRQLAAARLVLERTHEGETQVLLRGSDEQGWTLPGGWVGDHRNPALEAGLDGAWDIGNLIDPLSGLCREQLGLEPAWMSYVHDYEEEQHLCRVYGATLIDVTVPRLPSAAAWFDASRLERVRSSCPFLGRAVEQWLDDDAGIVRGKGKSEQQCLPTDGLNQYID